MLRTAVYIRKSSEEANKQTQSLERQQRDIDEFLARHNASADFNDRLDVKDTFKEQKTAKEPGRDVFNRMIDLVKKRRYDVVLCTEPSRLSRNPIDTGMLIHIMDQKYVQSIRTISNTYASESTTERFTLGLFLSISKYENDQRGKNAKSGMANRKAQGATTNIAPMGYMNVGETKGSRGIEPDGENFDILQESWRKLISGKYKVNELYDDAISQGFTRIAGYKGGIKRTIPAESSFRAVFRSEYYMGLLNGGSKGNHEPMVSKEEFEMAQVVLQKAGYKHSKNIENVTYENLLKEILVCGKTGNPFYVNVKTRYYCPTKDCSGRYYSASGPKQCPNCRKTYNMKDYKNVQSRKTFDVRGTKHAVYDKGLGKVVQKASFEASFIELLIDEHLKNIRISEGLFQIFKRQLYTLWLEQSEENKKRVSKKKKEIQKQEEKRKQLHKSLFSEEMNDQARADLEESILDINHIMQALQDEIVELQEEAEDGFEQAWQSLNVLLQAKTIFAPGTENAFEPKRRLVISLFSNLKFVDGVIIPEWREPFATIANAELRKQKSQNESEISALSSVWLPENPERQTRMESLYLALCRQHKGLVAFLKEPYVPVVTEEPKNPERLKKIIVNRKKFSRDEAAERFKSGWTYEEIGNACGVSKVAVWKALRESCSINS